MTATVLQPTIKVTQEIDGKEVTSVIAVTDYNPSKHTLVNPEDLPAQPAPEAAEASVDSSAPAPAAGEKPKRERKTTKKK